MKHAVIVHCWGGNPEYAWYPWTKLQLENLGYSVSIPSMPDTDNPQLLPWVETLTDAIGNANDELVLIGHSLGCVTIMRFLEQLPSDVQVSRVIFVAGFTDQLGFSELENFFVQPLDFKTIKSKSIRGFAVIQSDNDPFVSEQYGIRLCDELDATLTIKPKAFHMSGPVDDEESCIVLPEVIQAL